MSKINDKYSCNFLQGVQDMPCQPLGHMRFPLIAWDPRMRRSNTLPRCFFVVSFARWGKALLLFIPVRFGWGWVEPMKRTGSSLWHHCDHESTESLKSHPAFCQTEQTSENHHVRSPQTKVATPTFVFSSVFWWIHWWWLCPCHTTPSGGTRRWAGTMHTLWILQQNPSLLFFSH